MAISEKHMQQLRQFAPDHARIVERAMREKKREPETVEGPAPEFTIDLSNLTERLLVEDVEDVEDASGLSIQDVFANLQQGKVKGLAALVWVLRRKDDPSYKLADARKLPLVQMLNVVTASTQEEAESPLEASDAPSA